MTWATSHRPKTFSDLVAQSHIGTVLPRMVHGARQGSRLFTPALVLYGPRGTGKTSVGRILAKALNCTDPHPAEPGEPCADCETCLAIDLGTSPGVTEIDMASHGGVEDMRRIKADASFSIAEDWRVYLMDEAHSASKDAFNALLKLLEEPPPRTLFCMVTTEPESIPDTIRSRAMEFEFRRISSADIAARLRVVAEREGLLAAIESDLYAFLASRARGGMRDAIMALEQVVAAAHPERATVALARHVLGVTDAPARLLSAALAGDVAGGLTALSEAAYSGTSPAVLADDLLSGMTALVAVRTGLPASSYQDSPVSPEWLDAHAVGMSTSTLLGGLRTLWDARARIRGHDPASPTHLAAAYLTLVSALGGAPAAIAPRNAVATPTPLTSAPEVTLGPQDALDELASL